MSHWRRTRMISFRVSDSEFELLKTRSEAEGARSVSDFARLALCRQANGADAASSGQAPNADSEQITRLRDEVQELNAYVRRVAEMLERSRTPMPQRSNLVAAVRKAGGA